MNIEELIEEIYLLEENTLTAEEYKAKLRILLTAYTCEVAKIDEEVYKDADKIVYNGLNGGGMLTDRQKEQITEYNRLITEKYQAQPETPEPKLQVGWEYQNGRGEWEEIIEFINNLPHPYKGKSGSHYNPYGQWTIDYKSNSDLILSTGRPVQKQPSTPEQTLLDYVKEYVKTTPPEQLKKEWDAIVALGLGEGFAEPSPNWWESLNQGDLLINHVGDIIEVYNWYEERLAEKRVFVVPMDGDDELINTCSPYTPTPAEAIADLQAGKITVEQFQKVYK